MGGWREGRRAGKATYVQNDQHRGPHGRGATEGQHKSHGAPDPEANEDDRDEDQLLIRHGAVVLQPVRLGQDRPVLGERLVLCREHPERREQDRCPQLPRGCRPPGLRLTGEGAVRRGAPSPCPGSITSSPLHEPLIPITSSHLPLEPRFPSQAQILLNSHLLSPQPVPHLHVGVSHTGIGPVVPDFLPLREGQGGRETQKGSSGGCPGQSLVELWEPGALLGQ